MKGITDAFCFTPAKVKNLIELISEMGYRAEERGAALMISRNTDRISNRGFICYIFIRHIPSSRAMAISYVEEVIGGMECERPSTPS